MPERRIRLAHSYPIKEVCQALNSNKFGLREDEAKERLEKFGPNELVHEKGKSPLYYFFQQFLTPLNGILIIAALISFFAEHETDAYVIFAVILVNAIIGFSQEYNAEKAIESLKKMGAPQAEVLRRTIDEKHIEFEIPTREIVPGDLLILSVGDRVPADARLITCMNLHVDESMLTGESIPTSKKIEIIDENAGIGDRKNMVFGGTLVVQGRAKALVTKTGMNTEMGKIADIIQKTENVEVPLKKNIKKLTKMLGLLALIC